MPKPSLQQTYAGIDYGSKLAGTTVLCLLQRDQVNVFQSIKKQDADAFLRDLVREHEPTAIGLDAPLSLPGRYRGLQGYNDFFYRKGDREIGAMSPMFLGGLTARAMQLRESFESVGIRKTFEVYPAALAKEFTLPEYKKSDTAIERCRRRVMNEIATTLGKSIKGKKLQNWHQLDSLLALCSCLRTISGKGKRFGTVKEGAIHV